MAQKKRRRKKLDTSKLVCFLLVGSGLLITQECIYLMRLCIKSNYMASAAWLTAALSLAQVIPVNELTRYIDADIPVDKGLLLAAVEGVKTYSHIIALIAAFLDDFNSVFWGDASGTDKCSL